MAANTYILKSFSFNGSAITGMQSMDLGESGSTVDLQSDAKSHIDNTFMDSIGGTVNISTTDLNAIKSLRVGDAGTIIMVYQKRLRGRGADTGDITFTSAATCVITDIQRPGPSTGMSNGTISFRATSADGAAAIWTVT
jgi:hypothetical protein